MMVMVMVIRKTPIEGILHERKNTILLIAKKILIVAVTFLLLSILVGVLSFSFTHGIII